MAARACHYGYPYVDKATDRIITIMMAPFMSCGARMPVYVLFATAFFPTNGQNLVFGIYVIGIIAAIITGFLIKRVVLPGEVSAFVMEIPPYHIPTVKGVMMRTLGSPEGLPESCRQSDRCDLRRAGFLEQLGYRRFVWQ